MKKLYKNPVLQTIKIETRRMLADSLDTIGTVTDPLGHDTEEDW